MATKIGFLFAEADISAVDKLLTEFRPLERISLIAVLRPSSIEKSGTALRLVQADILLVLISSCLFPEISTAISKRADFIIDRAYKMSKAVVPVYLSDTSPVSLPEVLFHFLNLPVIAKSSVFPLGVTCQ